MKINQLKPLLVLVALVVGITSSWRATAELPLDIVPILAATACKGVGTVNGTEIRFDAQDFSRNFGAAVGVFDGSQIIRFGTGPSITTRTEYDICVPESGRYRLFIRTWAKGHTNNGLFIGVNGKIQRALPDHPLAGSTAVYVRKDIWSINPEWLEKPSDDHSGPVEVLLEKGLQTFVLHKRLIERPYINYVRLVKTGDN